ncbi:uncharacterized protein LOC129939294 [Eupeodes corollae]|uniref:uncharacterized protein LOC129939294 n=1 Tax=Eupeodes corollae TaxID=290404 RepID=UPI002492349F|nr:uncharacterized protein LOC129939294 [Eupeodes corollae]
MYLAGYIRKSNYLMTDDELHQWQRNAIVWCEFDNFLNSIIDGNLPQVSEILEESAINMAIESHGIQQRPNRVMLPSVQTIEAASMDDDLNFFDQQAINAAIEFQGLGIPPPI